MKSDERSADDVRLAELLGREIAAARVRRKLTQRELADRAGFSPSGLRNWELGARTPTVAHLVVLAKVLGANAGDWMNAAQDALEQGLGPDA